MTIETTPEKKPRKPEDPAMTRAKLVVRIERLGAEQRKALFIHLTDETGLRSVRVARDNAKADLKNRLAELDVFESIWTRFATLPPEEQAKVTAALGVAPAADAGK